MSTLELFSCFKENRVKLYLLNSNKAVNAWFELTQESAKVPKEPSVHNMIKYRFTDQFLKEKSFHSMTPKIAEAVNMACSPKGLEIFRESRKKWENRAEKNRKSGCCIIF